MSTQIREACLLSLKFETLNLSSQNLFAEYQNKLSQNRHWRLPQDTIQTGLKSKGNPNRKTLLGSH